MNGTDIEHLHLADCLLLAPRWLRISPLLVARQLWPDHWSETPHPISCCTRRSLARNEAHFSGDSGLAVEQIRVASTVAVFVHARISRHQRLVTASSVGGAGSKRPTAARRRMTPGRAARRRRRGKSGKLLASTQLDWSTPYLRQTGPLRGAGGHEGRHDQPPAPAPLVRRGSRLRASPRTCCRRNEALGSAGLPQDVEFRTRVCRLPGVGLTDREREVDAEPHRRPKCRSRLVLGSVMPIPMSVCRPSRP
jgi:hypothetical protein